MEGLANLKTEMPDLMILDLLMPKMDGFAVCKELQDPRVGKVPEDTYLNSDFGERGSQPRRYELETRLELDVDDYVEKPFSPDILLERVARLVKKKEGG